MLFNILLSTNWNCFLVTIIFPFLSETNTVHQKIDTGFCVGPITLFKTNRDGTGTQLGMTDDGSVQDDRSATGSQSYGGHEL